MRRTSVVRKLVRFCVLALSVMFVIAPPVQALTELHGEPVVIDGDSLEVNSVRLILYGVRAPTLNQHCAAGGADWSCGAAAAGALRHKISEGGGKVTCQIMGSNVEPPVAAVCRQGEVVLNRWLVEQGWALPDGEDGELLEDAQTRAIESELGVWRDGFTPSVAWRRAAGVETDDIQAGCSSCTLRHQALAKRLESLQVSEGETAD